jgi:hypothetical protein
VYYYPEGWFQVLDPRGTAVYEQALPLRVCLPGHETEYRMPWRPQSRGMHTFLVVIDSGQESLLQGIKMINPLKLLPGELDLTPTRVTRAE